MNKQEKEKLEEILCEVWDGVSGKRFVKYTLKNKCYQELRKKKEESIKAYLNLDLKEEERKVINNLLDCIQETEIYGQSLLHLTSYVQLILYLYDEEFLNHHVQEGGRR